MTSWIKTLKGFPKSSGRNSSVFTTSTAGAPDSSRIKVSFAFARILGLEPPPPVASGRRPRRVTHGGQTGLESLAGRPERRSHGDLEYLILAGTRRTQIRHGSVADPVGVIVDRIDVRREPFGDVLALGRTPTHVGG